MLLDSSSFAEALGEAIGNIILATFAILIGLAILVVNAIVNIICIIVISVRKKKDLPIKGWSITLIISLSIQLLILLVYFIAQFA